MTKFIRIGIGVVAGVVAGLVVYEIFKAKRKRASSVMPAVKKSNIVMFPSARPPYAEEAEAASE
jgi:uncharacterized membrane protein YraQ (UPF0718 family)